MLKEAFGSGATVEEAKQNAFESLGVNEDSQVEYEVIEMQQKKTLGIFGGKPAKVRAFVSLSQSDECASYIKAIIEKMGITGVTVSHSEVEGGAMFDIQGDDIGSIIGRRGETLDAIQYLASLAVNKKDSNYFRVVINIGNYREKREDALRGLAKKISYSVLKTGRNTTLEPMSPYERRIIHTTIQELNGVSSWSIGEEPNRAVVIGNDKKGRTQDHKDSGNYKGNKNNYKSRNRQSSKADQIKPQSLRSPRVLDDKNIPLYGKIDS